MLAVPQWRCRERASELRRHRLANHGSTKREPEQPLLERVKASRLRGAPIPERRGAHSLLVALSSLAALAAVFAGLPAPLALFLLMVFVLIGPGAWSVAFTARFLGRWGAMITSAGLGVSLTMIVSEVELWLGAWNPKATLAALAVLALCAQAIPWIFHSKRVATNVNDEPRRYWNGRSNADRGRLSLHAGIVSTGFVLWALSVPRIDSHATGSHGLLNALPVTFYLAFALFIIGGAWAVIGRWFSAFAVGAYCAAITMCLYATTAMVYDTPRYPWTYKHIGVTRFIIEHGSVDRSIDLYHNWPGFFSLNALLFEGAHADPIRYAAWSEIVFGLLMVGAAVFAVHAIDSNPRRVGAAALMFVLGNWVGQNYFAPQALAFPLTLVCLGVALRVRGGAPRARWLAPRWLPFRAPPSENSQSIPLALATTLCLPIVVAIVTSHQLSPVMLLLSLLAMALFGGYPLWSSLLLFGAIEASWLALSWPFLSSHYKLFSFGGIPDSHPQAERPGLAGLVWAGVSSRSVALVFVVLAAVGVVRRWRAKGSAVVPVLLAIAPGFVLAIQSYGGEGGLRAYLFALPWLALLAANAVLGGSPVEQEDESLDGPLLPRIRPARAWLLVPVAALIGTGTLVASTGLELSYYVPPSDVAGVVWFEENAAERSILASLSSTGPEGITARYVRFGAAAGVIGDTDLLRAEERRRPLAIPRLRLPVVRGFLDSLSNASVVYFMIGPLQRSKIALYGIIPAETVEGVVVALKRAPDFEIVFDHAGTTVWRYRPSARVAAL